MRRIDGHSTKTIDKHYALREPEDDVALAKVLVDAVLHGDVQWPSDHECKLNCESIENIDTFAYENQSIDNCGVLVLDDASDDEPLEYWKYGDAFGIAPPMLALCDADEVGEASQPDSPEKPSAASASSSSSRPVTTDDAKQLEMSAKKKKLDKKEKKADKKDRHSKKEKRALKKEKKDSKELVADVGGSTFKRPAAATAGDLASVAITPKRSRLDPDTKSWIAQEHDAVMKTGEVASRSWFEDACRRGLAQKTISPFTTAEGLRSYIRFRKPGGSTDID